MLISCLKLVFGEVINEKQFYYVNKLKLRDLNRKLEKMVFFYILSYFCFNFF